MIDWAGAYLADISPFIAIGVVAQLVDGALGMAFGVIASTSLLVMGVPPAQASSYVHFIKIFTGGANGLSHILHKNVDWRLCLRLSIAGIIGGLLGVQFLTRLPTDIAKPLVLLYLTAIGLYLLMRGIGGVIASRRIRFVEPIGFAGGFLDATGGGGWGPVVTSNLLLQGNSPRQTVGTVNVAEFFLALVVSLSFLLMLGARDFTGPVIGLIIGGIAAAPFGAWLAKRVAPRPLLIAVGIVLTATSAFGILRWAGAI